MKKLGIGMIIAGLGISAVGVAILVTKAKKIVDVDIKDVDINILSDIDEDGSVNVIDSLKKTVNPEQKEQPDNNIETEESLESSSAGERLSPLSDEAIKNENAVWDPYAPIKVMTAEELDKLGKVNPLE